LKKIYISGMVIAVIITVLLSFVLYDYSKPRDGAWLHFLSDDHSNSGIKIFIDGKYVGKTKNSAITYYYHIQQGKHIVEMHKDGYCPCAGEINVTRNDGKIIYFMYSLSKIKEGDNKTNTYKSCSNPDKEINVMRTENSTHD